MNVDPDVTYMRRDLLDFGLTTMEFFAYGILALRAAHTCGSILLDDRGMSAFEIPSFENYPAHDIVQTLETKGLIVRDKSSRGLQRRYYVDQFVITEGPDAGKMLLVTPTANGVELKLEEIEESVA